MVLASHSSENSTLDSFTSVGLALFIVILMIVGTLKLVKYLNRTVGKTSQSDNIQVLESLMISPTLRIHLIKIQSVVYVVAENAHTVEIITKLDESEISFDSNSKSIFNETLKSKWSELVEQKKTDSEEKRR